MKEILFDGSILLANGLIGDQKRAFFLIETGKKRKIGERFPEYVGGNPEEGEQ